MAVTEQTSGTQTATIGTEHTLADTGGAPDLPVGKTYILAIDVNALAAGEALELRVYSKVLTGGTARVIYAATIYNVQTDTPIAHTIPIPTAWYTKFTLKQGNGTGRAFPWAVYAL